MEMDAKYWQERGEREQVQEKIAEARDEVLGMVNAILDEEIRHRSEGNTPRHIYGRQALRTLRSRIANVAHQRDEEMK